MRRILTLAFLALFIMAGTLAAEEIKGKIKKLDLDKGVLVLEDDKDKLPIRVSRATDAVDDKGKPLADGLSDKALSVGATVTVTYELAKNKKGKIAKKIQLEKAEKKDKDDKK
jgi:hypothetical protein